MIITISETVYGNTTPYKNVALELNGIDIVDHPYIFTGSFNVMVFLLFLCFVLVDTSLNNTDTLTRLTQYMWKCDTFFLIIEKN